MFRDRRYIASKAVAWLVVPASAAESGAAEGSAARGFAQARGVRARVGFDGAPARLSLRAVFDGALASLQRNGALNPPGRTTRPAWFAFE